MVIVGMVVMDRRGCNGLVRCRTVSPPIRKPNCDIIGEPNTDNGPLKVHFWALGPYCLPRIYLAFRRNRLRGGSGGFCSSWGKLGNLWGMYWCYNKAGCAKKSWKYGRLMSTIDGALYI